MTIDNYCRDMVGQLEANKLPHLNVPKVKIELFGKEPNGTIYIAAPIHQYRLLSRKA